MIAKVNWNQSDAEIAMQMGWTLHRTSKERSVALPAAKINEFIGESEESTRFTRQPDWLGSRVRLTGSMFVRLLMVNPSAYWWEGQCTADTGKTIRVTLPDRGNTEFLKRGWTKSH
jgi:hypothetical protein